MTLQNHCHLGTSTPPTANVYVVRFAKKHPHTHTIVASAKRALTGKLIVNVLTDISGPVVFESWMGLALQVDSQTDLDTLVGMLGKTCYYVPPYHTDPPSGSDIKTVKLVRVSSIESSDPMEQYWWVTIDLEDIATEATYIP